MATDQTKAKATRLLLEGRIKPDVAPRPELFHVEGDHGNYQVVVGAHVAMCSCPAAGRCSHIEAAVKRCWASDRERVLMDAAVERRGAEKATEADAIFARLGA